MRPVVTMLERVADSDVPVLLTGESGVGKEVIARELHRRSARRARPFVKVNCAALPLELLESELFGHERGAFTGAHASRTGKFEFADGGTLLLDEIGEMPPALQAKLLHVLQDGVVTRLGSNRPVPTDVRVIAATNRALTDLLPTREFRPDLYYRLQVIEILVPPLRERTSEIVPLAEHFLHKYATRYRRSRMRLSRDLREAFTAYAWPGNVRELENVIKRLVILQDEPLILSELRALEAGAPEPIPVVPSRQHTPANGDSAGGVPPREDAAVDGTPLLQLARQAALSAERAAIQRALVTVRWNRRRAAERLGVSYKTLLNKMKECGITDDSAVGVGR
jgi:two-component system response regulator AtoC